MESLDELRKKLAKLENKRVKYWNERNLVKVVQVENEIKETMKMIAFIQDNEKTTLHELLEKQPQDVVDRFETLTLMIVGCVSLVDGLIMDENAILDKITGGKMKMQITEIGKQIKELTHKFVSMSDYNSNLATALDYGDFGDSLEGIIRKKAEEHLSWVQSANSEIKYARN